MEEAEIEAPALVETVGELGAVRFALAGALGHAFDVVEADERPEEERIRRAVAVVDREPGIGPATVDCERFSAVEVNLGDRIVLLDHNAELEPSAPQLPELKPLPPFEVDPESGEIAGTIGGLEHLVDGVSALAAALGGRNIAMAVFETTSSLHPWSITARADGSEQPVVAIGEEAFTLPRAEGA